MIPTDSLTIDFEFREIHSGFCKIGRSAHRNPEETISEAALYLSATEPLYLEALPYFTFSQV